MKTVEIPTFGDADVSDNAAQRPPLAWHLARQVMFAQAVNGLKGLGATPFE